MPKKSKHTLSRLINIKKARARLPRHKTGSPLTSGGSQPAPDSSPMPAFADSEPDHSQDIPVPGLEELESDSDSEEEEEDGEQPDETALERFNIFMRKAQAVAAEKEKSRRGESDGEKVVKNANRPVHYTKNSGRTQRRHAANRRSLKAGGAKFISDFFGSGAHMPDAESMAIDIGVNAEDDVEIIEEQVNGETIEVPVIDSCADSMESGLFGEPAITPVVVTDDERKQVEELLRNLRDSSPESATDQALNQYTHTRFPELRQALKELTVKSKDKTIDVTFRSRITAMVSTLNLYLDPDLSYTWRQSSALAAKAAGKNAISYGRSIRNWLHTYLHRKKLPLHNHGGGKSSILDDEDIRSQVQLHMMEAAKKGHITAQDLVDFIASREMQEKLPDKLSISERTAQRWLNKMNFRYARKPNGMYIDGHERPDVVEYRNKFVERWQRHELRMLVYDENGKECRKPVGYKLDNPGQPFRLELITHDESTFYANDRSRQRWFHTSEAATPVRKGEGASIMVSDFLTPTFGRYDS